MAKAARFTGPRSQAASDLLAVPDRAVTGAWSSNAGIRRAPLAQLSLNAESTTPPGPPPASGFTRWESQHNHRHPERTKQRTRLEARGWGGQGEGTAWWLGAPCAGSISWTGLSRLSRIVEPDQSGSLADRPDCRTTDPAPGIGGIFGGIRHVPFPPRHAGSAGSTGALAGWRTPPRRAEAAAQARRESAASPTLGGVSREERSALASPV
jgi:hypothetical protein